MPENKQTPFYKPSYTRITREIPLPLDPQSKLEIVNKESGLTKADEILDFCRIPRSSREIGNLLGIVTVVYVNRYYLQPLIDSGKLLMTNPNKDSNLQRYVNADYAPPIPTEESVLEFCQVPHTKTEIAKHYGFSMFQIKGTLNSLIESERLVGTDTKNPKNHWQMYTSNPAEANILTDEKLIEYCNEPKSRRQIAERFRVAINRVPLYVNPLIESGRLKTYKYVNSGKWSKVIDTDKYDFVPPRKPITQKKRYEKIEILESDIINFCQTPKSRKEVAEHFGLKLYLSTRYLGRLAESGKLKMTIPFNPDCKNQRFVDCETEIIALSEESLLEYCSIPRRLDEITEHFNFSTKTGMSHALQRFIKCGKLKHTAPKGSKYRKFVSICKKELNTIRQ